MSKSSFIALLPLALLLTGCFDEEAKQREKSCRVWGITDSDEIKKCRESAKIAEALISPRRQAFVATELENAKNKLASINLGKTLVGHVDEYAPIKLEELESKLPFFWLADAKDFEILRDRKIRVGGVITVNEEKTEYRLSNLSGVGVRLDIEGLNRFERAFIKENCDLVPLQCHAELFARVGNLADKITPLIEPGLVVDQVDLEMKASFL